MKRVRDVMLSPVPTVGPEASLRTVAALLSEHDLDAVVVVDERGRPAGVVSRSVLSAALDAITGELDRRQAATRPRAVGGLSRTPCPEAPPLAERSIGGRVRRAMSTLPVDTGRRPGLSGVHAE
ncbi:MAG: HPP family protein [Candidatus Velamenicoccus archaeovorus]